MMNISVNLLVFLVSLIIFFLFGFFVRLAYAKSKLTSAENEAKRIMQEALKESENKKAEIILEGESKLLEEKKAQDRENRAARLEIQKMEKSVSDRSASLDRKAQELDESRIALNSKEEEIRHKEEDIRRREEDVLLEYERVAGLTAEDAKKEVVARIEEDARRDAVAITAKIVEEAREEGERRSQELMVSVMQRMASSVVQDNCVSTVSLPNDELKGRIIGREGRNIKALENLLGVDIIIDDTPEAVIVSSFNPIRKVIATRVLEVLSADGRIHQARIEDTVSKVTREIDKISFEEGEKVLMDLGLTLTSSELTRCLGRLYFRRSYGQNVLQHSKETALLAGMIASELHLNAGLARRAALLHDIGKAQENSEIAHAESGARLAERLGENKLVVNAIRSHHNECEPESLEAVVVQIADAISASRPGARDGSVENYIKRLDDIEKIALSFDGVDKAYAIQAGRDIRVIVDSKKVSDTKAREIAGGVSKRLKAEYRFLGQIKITVIRETKFVETIG